MFFCTAAIEGSPMRAMILHKLSANVSEARRDDTPEDSFIHVFRLLLNKSHYQDAASEEMHLNWVKSLYHKSRMFYVLSNKPLVICLKELMQFAYFEQEGKVPVTLYHGWSSNGTKGSVRDLLLNQEFLLIFKLVSSW